MPWRPPVHRPRRPARAPDPRPSSTARGYGSAAWQRVRRLVIARDGGKCRMCGRLCSGLREAQIDHVRAKSPDEPAEATPLDGLRLLCRQCHSRHGEKYGTGEAPSP